MSLIKDIIRHYYLSLTLKDPCKTCLVKACCNEKCEQVVMFENFFFPHDTIKEKRKWAIFTLSVSILSIGIVIFAFARDYIIIRIV